MSEFPVKYRLYASDGVSLVYTFTYVQLDNSPQDAKDYVEITSLRGQGSIIIAGSDKPWDLELGFVLVGTDYEDLIAKMDSVQSTIALQTKYVLKIDRTPITTQSYNVMRLEPIEYADEDNFRNTYQRVNIRFRVDCW